MVTQLSEQQSVSRYAATATCEKLTEDQRLLLSYTSHLHAILLEVVCHLCQRGRLSHAVDSNEGHRVHVSSRTSCVHLLNAVAYHNMTLEVWYPRPTHYVLSVGYESEVTHQSRPLLSHTGCTL